MIVEIAAGCKRLATVVTLVGLLPGVDPPVGVEAAARAEPLLTEVAHVRPLPRMNPDVPLEQARPVKHLAAGVAGQHGFGPPRGWL